MDALATRRLARATRSIEGWFSTGAAGLFALLDEVQRRDGVAGDLFEIGAHHGKSAVVLAAMLRDQESLGVCDIFGGQEHNASASGAGDRAVFEANMRRHAPNAKLRVFEQLSSTLAPEDLDGPCRFFHVDGGHLADEALADMELGLARLAQGGVIVVDDPFRIEWPGVTEAILEFLVEHADLAPVALGFNKLVIADADQAASYREAVTGDEAWTYVNPRVFDRKTLPIADQETPIFYVPTYRQIDGLHVPVAEARHAARRLRRAAGRLASR